MDKKYEAIITVLGKEKVKQNVLLADHTTYKIGGPADLFFTAETEEELIKAVKTAKENETAFFILGGGSNILMGDKGFRGLVISIQYSAFSIQPPNGEFLVMASAGVRMSELLNECVENSLTGLEFMAGIPGTIGGAIRGNAGAWQRSISEAVKRVRILNESGEIVWLNKDECQFNYRDSRFKHNNEVVLEVELQMQKGSKQDSEKEIAGYLEKRASQPKEPSAGCVFVNPKPESAGALIEQCGLKGKQIGGAKISEKHANFIINVGNAKASDVIALIELAKKNVQGKFAIELKEEILKIGAF